ncbi:MAG: LON peptidase substrate-binding domain-containing protein, partial [Candidatus Sumerlaeota bacterium]|nr:LON peptidase substrate-binding domain-containing protein [Candidatus Sumerlaeota bacterium]
MVEESNISVDEISRIFKGESIDIPEELPVIDFDNFIMFPFMIAPIVINNPSHKQLISEAVLGNRLVGVFFRQPVKPDLLARNISSPQSPPPVDTLAEVGCASMILRMLKIPDGSMRIILHGLQRITIREITQREPYIKARIIPVQEVATSNITVDAL